jgi:hypothetical protein
MIRCPLCDYKFQLADKPEVSNDDFGVIRMRDARQLLRRTHYQYLARRLAARPESSREIPNWIADQIWTFPGAILDADGKPFKPSAGAIDRAFGNDKSFRWIRAFIASADGPPKQIPQARLADRLGLIDLGFLIEDFYTHDKG